MLINIKNDLYDISSRIKEIEENYSIKYDTEKEKYLLFRNGKYQLAFPFKHLDARALDYAWETRLENLDYMLKKVDRHNAELQRKEILKAHDEIENRAAKCL